MSAPTAACGAPPHEGEGKRRSVGSRSDAERKARGIENSSSERGRMSDTRRATRPPGTSLKRTLRVGRLRKRNCGSCKRNWRSRL